uniref:Somatostatin/Cortistatin C-terminal domain-containing protein n=1 Tax=Gouania willdenowi TaxID=441366 RepID=A0A8C5ETN9_GOUWI
DNSKNVGFRLSSSGFLLRKYKILPIFNDVSRWFLLKFMPNLMTDAPSDEMIRELEEDEEDEEETKARGRDAVMRRHLSLAQRERKAGCRNFFWKTFTSC